MMKYELLALRNERIASERIGIFAADQHANLADFCIGHTQAVAVAIGPDQLLVESWDQLAMVV